MLAAACFSHQPGCDKILMQRGAHAMPCGMSVSYLSSVVRWPATYTRPRCAVRAVALQSSHWMFMLLRAEPCSPCSSWLGVMTPEVMQAHCVALKAACQFPVTCVI
jgi:hypothetical protein